MRVTPIPSNLLGQDGHETIPSTSIQWRFPMVKERLFTAKELAFIAAYQGHRDGARAAVAAGYSPNGAAKTAWKLLKDPAVRQALEVKQRQVIDDSVRQRAAGIVSAMSA